MPCVVDSSGWIEYFGDRENAHRFAPVIEDHKNVIVPSICVYEVFRWIKRETDQATAIAAFHVMNKGRLVPISGETALTAADWSETRGLALADSLIYEVTMEHNAILYTQDAHFKELDRVKFFPK